MPFLITYVPHPWTESGSQSDRATSRTSHQRTWSSLASSITHLGSALQPTMYQPLYLLALQEAAIARGGTSHSHNWSLLTHALVWPRWIPNHCGQSNMYMLPYKCIVTGVTSTVPLDTPAVPPRWCEDDAIDCVQGAKQMIFWAQNDGNNVVVEGNQRDGQRKSPGYNQKMGFLDGMYGRIWCIT